jgi:hypothetical protein
MVKVNLYPPPQAPGLTQVSCGLLTYVHTLVLSPCHVWPALTMCSKPWPALCTLCRPWRVLPHTHTHTHTRARAHARYCIDAAGEVSECSLPWPKYGDSASDIPFRLWAIAAGFISTGIGFVGICWLYVALLLRMHVLDIDIWEHRVPPPPHTHTHTHTHTCVVWVALYSRALLARFARTHSAFKHQSRFQHRPPHTPISSSLTEMTHNHSSSSLVIVPAIRSWHASGCTATRVRTASPRLSTLEASSCSSVCYALALLLSPLVSATR